MTFHSILFANSEARPHSEQTIAPDFFIDLNLNQIVDTITAGKEEYDLKPFFYTFLRTSTAIKYRQEIFQDLENKTLFDSIHSFTEKMHTMQEYLIQSNKLYYKYQKERWFLDAVDMYCNAVDCLTHELFSLDLKSRGFLAFRTFLKDYTSSLYFTSLWAETNELLSALSAIKYCVFLKGNTVEVRPYKSEADYSKEVEKTFDKFKQNVVKDYRIKFHEWPDMNHVEARILDLVAQQHADVFLHLENYYKKNANYLDKTIHTFYREIHFYLAYLEYISQLKKQGLKFCYPEISNENKEIYDYEGFDLALAYKLINQGLSVVCNDFYLKGEERIIVVTGPNQGGKTTFARTFGQLHYLACLGCPVPGKSARLFLYDRLFTHFEKKEIIENLHGKLEDDLYRIHFILKQATSNSIIIMNEIFNSTTLQDAIFLGKEILVSILQLDALCVFVTFIDEFASLSKKTVSMVSTIDPVNPALRTFKIIRKPADGLSYALAIAEKHHLTYTHLKERIKS